MQKTPFAQTGPSTTRLDFACSNVMAGLGCEELLAMPEATFNSGIGHFNVAPMYGFGAAERSLGELLVLYFGELSVTTKYGVLAQPDQGPPSFNFGLAVLVTPIGLLPAASSRCLLPGSNLVTGCTGLRRTAGVAG